MAAKDVKFGADARDKRAPRDEDRISNGEIYVS